MPPRGGVGRTAAERSPVASYRVDFVREHLQDIRSGTWCLERLRLQVTTPREPAIRVLNTAGPARYEGEQYVVGEGAAALALGQNLAGQLVVAGAIGSISVAHAYSPYVLTVKEAGIQRQVEATTPAAPLLASQAPSTATSNPLPYVTFALDYEGLASAAHPSDPQITIRVDNTDPVVDPLDLSLVTDSSQAKFNLARLDATHNGTSGVLNVSVEGNILASVSAAASAYLGAPSNPAGVYLPGDNLEGVAVRDFVPNASIRAASIQGVAFGQYAANGMMVSATTAQASNAAALLAPRTTIAEAGATFLVPFADINPVALFFDSAASGNAFSPNDVRVSIEDSSADPQRSADSLARGSDVALVTVSPSSVSPRNASIQAIDIHGDNASIVTAETVAQRISSTGPLGDVTLAGPFNGVLTAPRMFGTLTINGGTTQTTVRVSTQAPSAAAIDAIATKSVGASLALTDLFDAAPSATNNVPRSLSVLLLKQTIANVKGLAVSGGKVVNGE